MIQPKKWYVPVLVVLLAACTSDTGNTGNTGSTDDPKTNVAEAAPMSYSVIKTYPHDPTSYTQGLIVYKGAMYEGTGNYGQSHLMKVDLETGKALKKIALDSIYFGEGVTILNDTLYQLTYKEKKVFVYTLPDLKKVKEFTISRDGWGLTHNGKELIATDGTSNLYYYDPATFQLLRTQAVTEGGSLSNNLNELEYIDGYIYANKYQAADVFKIDPASGFIVGKADLNPLWQRIRAVRPEADVPNGIAYDADTKKIYVTGKWWPELYEIQFSH